MTSSPLKKSFGASDPLSPERRAPRADLLIAACLGLLAALGCFLLARSIDEVVLHNWGIWFGSDTPRVAINMSERFSNHYRSKVHPLLPLLTYPLVRTLAEVLSRELMAAVQVLVVFVAGLWCSALFVLLRLLGLRRPDAVLFALLGCVSSAALFWLSVPEVYSLGSLSILLALIAAAAVRHRAASVVGHTVANAISFSFTVTNWMFGALATLVAFPRRKAVKIIASAFLLVSVLWLIQKQVFPSSRFFLDYREEVRYMLLSGSGGPAAIARCFFLHSMVMPEIQERALQHPERVITTIQASPLGSGGILATIAIGAWIALLGLGAWGLLSPRKNSRFSIVLGLTLAGQLALHLLYGEETFLYALHYAPLLLVLAACGTLTRARPLVLALGALLLLAAGANNLARFREATDFLDRHDQPVWIVKREMFRRHGDPWPRGTGHVVLARPGTKEEKKAYHEPGGSFSPAVGSFGVSLWLSDRAGKLLATSDGIPLDQVDQRLTWTKNVELPAIVTTTAQYRAEWSAAANGAWRLLLMPAPNSGQRMELLVRSVGPAGGPIRSLDWNGKRLSINGGWQLRLEPSPRRVVLGAEDTRGWMRSESRATHWEGESGWGFARVDLEGEGPFELLLEPPEQPGSRQSESWRTRSALKLDLPDPRFEASIDAQVAHQVMGVVGREARPGDPTNYPVPWLRDGAYTVVSLARAGLVDEARRLCAHMADNDFFGGFGAEADGPGLAIWAIVEVAQMLDSPDFDREIWPHVRRKAQLILRMLSTTEDIHEQVTTPIVPGPADRDLTLVCEAARNGLIIGKMDHHRPLLFINAVSYRGLSLAARLASRIGRADDGDRWRAAARELKQAWKRAYQPPESDNPRTHISSLWPTWVAAHSKDVLVRVLRERWTERRTEQGGFRSHPPWTYFELAEAHQWLLLGRPDPAWKTLIWFWEHQASPGLYTWWEGYPGDDTYHRWEKVWGWEMPPHITPHYWTAAEMLLLQIEMLAYVDETADEGTGPPTLILGAGIPSLWLGEPLSARNLTTTLGRVDWSWEDGTMEVHIRGGRPETKVELGPSFPATAEPRVRHSKH